MNYLTIIKFKAFDQDALEMRITDVPLSEQEIFNIVTENTKTAYLTGNVLQYSLSQKKEVEISHIGIEKRNQNKFKKYLGE